jgi:predicted transcriptional regulator
MSVVQVNTRLDKDVAANLDRLAVSRSRSKTWLVNEAITGFVNREIARDEAIREGIADADAGRTKPIEQVRTEFHAWVDSFRK